MHLLVASIAVPLPMGQQVYEEQVIGRAHDALRSDWKLRRCVVRTLRSTLPGTARVPAVLLDSAPSPARRLAGAILYRGADVVHRMDLRLPPAPSNEVLTVHDVATWRYDDEGRAPADSGASARRARVVLCPSVFAAGEVSDVLGVGTPVVVHNGVDEAFFRALPLPSERLHQLGVSGGYILHAGGCTARKNLAALAAAWQRVRAARPNISLVMVGPPDLRRDALFASLDGVVRLGRVGGGMLVALVAGAEAVVVPSLYEGFGLPALEAMAAGTAVVASLRAALPEVCGDAAVLVEPHATGISDGLIDVLDSSVEVSAMIERGHRRAALFTWQASAEGHARAWVAAAS